MIVAFQFPNHLARSCASDTFFISSQVEVTMSQSSNP
jgi:hypothetical protein